MQQKYHRNDFFCASVSLSGHKVVMWPHLHTKDKLILFYEAWVDQRGCFLLFCGRDFGTRTPKLCILSVGDVLSLRDVQDTSL